MRRGISGKYWSGKDVYSKRRSEEVQKYVAVILNQCESRIGRGRTVR